MTHKIEARVYPEPAYRKIGLYIRKANWQQGSYSDPGSVLQPVDDGENMAFVRIAPGASCPPSFMLEESEAQVLANTLWDAGIRPVGSNGSAGQLAAKEAHLQDMRALAFQGLKLQKPT